MAFLIFNFHVFALVFCVFAIIQAKGQRGSFNRNYIPLWGQKHFSLINGGKEVQLLMDRSSGAGFRSKLEFGSGFFDKWMKIPNKRTEGIVTSFYLTSAPDNQAPGNHFELDYEFLGTNGTVQTNVYDNDGGHREQSFKLWFDPSKDFHSYKFLWNSHQIVFYIDNIPIRVFKNNKAHGVDYPTKPMHIEASIWNADWAGPVDWSHAPFTAHYTNFDVFACPAQSTTFGACSSVRYPWNSRQYWELSTVDKQRMADIRRRYMSYDYCRQKQTSKLECALNP